MAQENERKAQEATPAEAAGGQQAPVESAEELRKLASAVEAAGSEALAGLLDPDREFPLRTGNLREFPRPAPEQRAAEEGLVYLEDAVRRAVGMLYALAAAREQGQEISPVLRATVQPYIAAVQARK